MDEKGGFNMNMKRNLMIGAIVVIAIVGMAFLTSKKEVESDMLSPKISEESMNSTDNSTSSNEMMAETATMSDEDPVPMMDNDPKHFTLKDVDGNTVSLNDFKGQKVYLKFWASWCSICLAGIDEIDQFSGEMNDFVILTVVSPNYNGEQSEADFINWYEGLELKNMTTLLDPDGTVAKAYGVRAYPTSVFIDSEGGVFKTIPGHMDKESIMEMMSEIK